MRSTLFCLLCLVSAFFCVRAVGESAPAVVVFSEAEFPAVDSASPSAAELKALLPATRFVTAQQLSDALSDAATGLLVLPYGSAFPEAVWADLYAFLQRGGNLLVLGGRPFTRAAYRDGASWRLRDYSVRFTRELMIDQYQVTPGSEGLEFQSNPDLVMQVSRFFWKRAFSPVIRLSAVDLYKRDGATGSLDARLDPIAWGIKDNRRMSVPAIQIDHIRNRYSGGRWIFLNCDLPEGFYGSSAARELIPVLVEVAARGSEEFSVRPTLPLYSADEPIELEASWYSATKPARSLTARITMDPGRRLTKDSVVMVNIPASQPIVLPAASTKGLHVIQAELLDGGKVRAIYRSGFWIRDQEFLRSGPHLTLNQDYFELDGHPLPVVGTTYMASDVQRLFFDHPNVYVWDRDLAQISAAGLNMVRTGWWTGWDKLCDETGRPYAKTLRTIEAYLMTARKYGLPVQFNFFAFLPEVLGGINPYLDPEANRRQQKLVSSVVERFHDVPFVAWDLINEPSISQDLWKTRPNGDHLELAEWNQWLSQRYPDRAVLAHAWNLPSGTGLGVLALPTELQFTPRGTYSGANSLKLHDYFLFAQETFANWVRGLRDAIRAAGSQQPITVGQDEGGYIDRLSPAFFGQFVDFTTNHSWWENDSLLWDSLMAKQPGMPMLMQETGLQRELTLDEIARLTPENEAAQLERKIAMSFVQGSGAIQWLWNANAYMTLADESPIGALLADGTEKPEATVLRQFANFSKTIREDFRNPQLPAVAIVTSQAAQFSTIQFLQVEAQRKSVRALGYYSRVPAYAVAENQIAKLGVPKLAILPSPQSLSENTWQSLLNYVSAGGNLLVTGPIERDEHWHRIQRSKSLNVDVQVEPLTFHNAEIRLSDQTIPLSFDQQKQAWLEALRFPDGVQLKEVPHGRGRIFWAAYPVELADGVEPTGRLYSHVLNQLGASVPFDLESKVPPGVLIYPTVLQNAILYVLVSDNSDTVNIDLRDELSKGRLTLCLRAGHAALALIQKSDGAVLAKYGF